MNLSQIALAVSPSPTLKLNQQAARLKAAGEPVIHLGGGEPISQPPIEALQAAHALLDTGAVRYPPVEGTPALRQAVIAYTERFYRRQISPANVLITSGAKQAIMLTLRAVVDPGDEVLLFAPYWVSYPEMVKLCAGVPVVVTPAEGYSPTLAEVEAKLSPKTKALILNAPNNPTGLLYPEALVADLVALCERRGIWLLLDDIYHRLIFGGAVPLSAFDYATVPQDRTQLVVLNGVSKQYAMTGFRVGWAVGNPTLLNAMSNLQSQETSGVSPLVQHAATAALNGDQASVQALVADLERKRAVIFEGLQRLKRVRVQRSQGAFYSFADFSAYDPESSRLAERLLAEAKVATVPGREFGMEGHLRLSFCGSEAELIEGLARLRWALDETSPTLELGQTVLTRR